MNNVIYGLIDPNTKELRYVGYSNNLSRRLRAHCNPSNLKKITHKNNWINQLISMGQKPDVIVLETYDTQEELPQAEIEMISYCKYIGCNLTNATNGGDGAYGRIVSEETRKKVSISNTGKKQSKEARENWKLANKGKPSPNKGNKASLESRKKMSLAHIGKQGKKRIFSDEQAKQLLEEYGNTPGATKIGLAKKYKVSRYVIFDIFKRAKIESA